MDMKQKMCIYKFQGEQKAVLKTCSRFDGSLYIGPEQHTLVTLVHCSKRMSQTTKLRRVKNATANFLDFCSLSAYNILSVNPSMSSIHKIEDLNFAVIIVPTFPHKHCIFAMFATTLIGLNLLLRTFQSNSLKLLCWGGRGRSPVVLRQQLHPLTWAR